MQELLRACEADKARLDSGGAGAWPGGHGRVHEAGQGLYREAVGRDCKELPAFIIKRLPCRFTYDNNYFNDRWQGIPMGGYTKMVEKMPGGVEVRLNTDYFDLIKAEPDIVEKIVYTGCIDEFFSYKLGALQYRSVRFETEELPEENDQGDAVVNYTEREVPYTRVIEHKHFEFGKQPTTIISREYSAEWKLGLEPYYPVNDEKNGALYSSTRNLRMRRALADGWDSIDIRIRLSERRWKT